MDPAADPGRVEKLVLNLIGMGYMATIAGRIGLAARNLTQTIQTTWVLLGATDNLFLEAVGRSLTRKGRNKAIRAGAVRIKQSGLAVADDIAKVQPRPLRWMSNIGMKLYNTADEWNRVLAFHMGDMRATKAIGEYAKRIEGHSGEFVKKAQRRMFKETGLFSFDQPTRNEFLRRLHNSGPEAASEFFGRHVAEFTQWIYGRGNQGKFQRNLFGRFLGQYGTWPAWYADFVHRTVRNLRAAGEPLEAMRFLSRLGMANAALYGATAVTGIELTKWAAVSSLSYTGGPGVEVVLGVRDMVRGAGGLLQHPEDKFSQSRIKEGLAVAKRAGKAFIPGRYMVEDFHRYLNARTPREKIAAALSTRQTREMTIQDQLDLLTNIGRMSTDIDADVPIHSTPAEMLDEIMRVRQRKQMQLPDPSVPLPPPGTQTQTPGKPPQGGQTPSGPTPPSPQGPAGPPGLPQGIPGPAESTPIPF